ncbi:MAG TPA: peroxiredoxin [Vicinamibacterales bacterium]|jgi:peroxiredoxin
MSVTVGSKAPDFTLPNQELKPVTLSDELKNRHVVLAFFPAAFTSVCTKELCTFRDSMAKLNDANAAVFGISVDTPFTLKTFGAEQKLNFPLLSDFNKDVIRKYDVVIDDLLGLKGLAKRAVFVVDKSGTVRHAEVLADARNEPDYGKVQQALAAI